MVHIFHVIWMNFFQKKVLSDLNSFVGLVGTSVSLSIYISIIGVLYFLNSNPDEAF